MVEHYRAGIEAVAAALRRRAAGGAARRRSPRAPASLINAGVPEELARRHREPAGARRRAGHRLGGGPHRQSRCADVAATYFAAGAFFQLDRIANAARGIHVTDYFDRLALDRALDSIGEAERRLTAEMVGNGATGPAAVDAWVAPRAGEVERIRAAVHGIASSGLTLSKLSVAASLLGDLVKH